MRYARMAGRVLAGALAATVALVGPAGCEDTGGEPQVSTPPDAGTTTPAQLRFATTDDAGFTPMPKPRPGDWLSQFHEPGQTFDEYVASSPVRPTPERSTIAIRPLGDFDSDQQAMLAYLTDFCGIWFDCRVQLLDPLPLPDHHRRQRDWLGRPLWQYRTDYLLDGVLKPSLPEHALCYLGITMADLYPEESWNFVFGQASLKERVGVHSLVRYFPGFYGEPAETEDPAMTVRRACKVLVHEAGHMLGLQHCVGYQCTMNGSNSLEESDRRPLRLCPPCLRKLAWNTGFDVLVRYAALRDFCREHGLDDEADWTEERMARIRRER